jgi:hypothetical protein
MSGAVTRGSCRDDLAALGNEALQRADVLEIDLQRLVSAEAAYLATAAGTASTHSAAATSLAPATLAAIATASFATIIAATTPRTSIAAASAAVFTSFFVWHFYS